MKNIKILVPIDFSDLSLKALEAAETMARLFEGKITPLHAYIPITEMEGPYSIGLGPSAHEDYEEIEKTLTERLNSVAKEHVDGELLNEGKIAVGNPAYSIVEASKEYDMIVMSTHGRTGFTRFILGSVAEKVLRLAHVPVLVVEEESKTAPIKRMLVTTDFSENSAAAFPYARDIAKASGARIDLVHIISYEQFEDEEASDSFVSLRKKRLELLAKEHFHDISEQLNLEVVVSSDTPHEAIFKRAKEISYNLLVMATVGRTGIDYLMMGSTTANVVRHVNTAVLSVNPKREEDEEES